MKATFVHVNLTARDWKALAEFYESVFGVVKVPPERDFQGRDLGLLPSRRIARPS